MTSKGCAIAIAVVLLTVGCVGSGLRRSSVGRIVDLTHAFDEATVYWPTAEGFRLESDFRGEHPNGYHYEANRFSSAEHGGTHLDAPIHFYAGRNTVDEIPLERLIGPGVVVDLTAACAEDPDYQVGVVDLLRWEREHGETLDDKIVLLHTGFGAHWPDRTTYLGTDERGESGAAKLHFPGLHPEAAGWLARNRAIRAIGLDTASIDHGPSTRFESHVALFEHDIPAFENLAHLDQLPASGFRVVALPMKIAGGSGAPLRIVAILDAPSRLPSP
jgi:kynurenine formamidase